LQAFFEKMREITMHTAAKQKFHHKLSLSLCKNEQALNEVLLNFRRLNFSQPCFNYIFA